MTILIKATGLELTSSLKTYIEEKLGPIARFIKQFDAQGAAEMRVEVGRTSVHHHKGPVFMAEIDLRLPNKVLRAVHEDVDVRTAIDVAKQKLHAEIEKYKSKAQDHTAWNKKNA